jgi:transposase
VAPAPARPIDGGMATEALITHVVVSKFCDGLPLYRQSQMLARPRHVRRSIAPTLP